MIYIQTRDNRSFGQPRSDLPVGHPDYVASFVEVPAEIRPWIEAGPWLIPAWKPAGGLDRLRTFIHQALARRRYQAETAGVSVSLSQGRKKPVTVHLDTARDARPSLLGAAFGAQLDSTIAAQWKDARGQFVEVTSAGILQLASSALRHVQACYAHEASIRSALDAAGDQEALLAAAQRIETGWPA